MIFEAHEITKLSSHELTNSSDELSTSLFEYVITELIVSKKDNLDCNWFFV